MTSPATNLTQTLKEIDAIVAWFDAQEDVDVEEGLVRIQKGAALIGAAKARLKDVENTFDEITKDLHED